MGRPMEQFKSRLNKATSSRKEDAVPNAVVIAADPNGSRAFMLDI
jgi:hypothetical protein